MSLCLVTWPTAPVSGPDREEHDSGRCERRRVQASGRGGIDGVITSAGLVLAALFAVLGVLLDTVLVRTLLVPALVILTGSRFWWPSTLSHADPDTSLPCSATGEPVPRTH